MTNNSPPHPFLFLLSSNTQAKGIFSASSDSPSTLSILSEHITACATASRVRITSSTPRIHPTSQRHVLSLLHHRLVYLHALPSLVALTEACAEVQASIAATAGAGAGAGGGSGEGENGSSSSSSTSPLPLASLANAIMAHAPKYSREAPLSKAALEALEGLAIDNFVDAHKLGGGRDVTGKIGGLKGLVGGGSGGRYAMAGGADAAAAFMENPK